MRLTRFGIWAVLIYSPSSNAQQPPLKGLICQPVGQPGITIQQSDADGNPIPFECLKTDIKLMEKGELVKHISPGMHRKCGMILNDQTPVHSKNGAIGIWGESTGTFELVLMRGTEIKTFTDLTIKSDSNDPCTITPVHVTFSW